MSDCVGENGLLRAEHLGKVYPDGQVQALIDVNFTIRAGEVVTIMGPSGSGKSTLLSLLGGLESPSSGQVVFEGQTLSAYRNLDEFRTQKIGFIFQSFLLLPTLTALENVQVPMFETSLAARARAEKAARLLEAVGLSHRMRHLPSRLSVGERQRVAIARSLANDPAVLLADEPTGNLDSHTALDILDLFTKLHDQRSLTLVIVTHWEALADYATRVIRLRDGRIVEDNQKRNGEYRGVSLT